MWQVKNKCLQNFLEAHKNRPRQSDPDWINSRGIIGGSTFQKLVVSTRKKNSRNKNKDYIGPTKSSLQSLFTKFDFKMPAMNWGHLCEPLSTKFIGDYLKTVIHETGSIPGLTHKDILIQSYSPDGLACVNNDDVIELLNADFNLAKFSDSLIDRIQSMKLSDNNSNSIILLEIKNPHSRDVGPAIPPEYKKQPIVGMATIPIVDYSLFINTMFRKCNINQFDFNADYDDSYHQPGLNTMPEYLGMIGIYEIKEINNADDVADICQDPRLASLITQTRYLIDAELKNVNSIYDSYHDIFNQVLLCRKIWQDNKIQLTLSEQARIIYEICRGCPLELAGLSQINNILLKIVNINKPVDKIDELILDYGLIDFGESDTFSFNKLMQKVIDDRGKSTGYRCYYPSMIDTGDAKKWLYLNIIEFIDHCNKKVDGTLDDADQLSENEVLRNKYTCKPIGFMPCKLMKIAVFPVMPKPLFIQKNRDKIIEVAEFVMHVREVLKTVPECDHAHTIEVEIFKFMNPGYVNDDDEFDTSQGVGAFDFQKVNEELLDL